MGIRSEGLVTIRPGLLSFFICSSVHSSSTIRTRRDTNTFWHSDLDPYPRFAKTRSARNKCALALWNRFGPLFFLEDDDDDDDDDDDEPNTAVRFGRWMPTLLFPFFLLCGRVANVRNGKTDTDGLAIAKERTGSGRNTRDATVQSSVILRIIVVSLLFGWLFPQSLWLSIVASRLVVWCVCASVRILDFSLIDWLMAVSWLCVTSKELPGLFQQEPKLRRNPETRRQGPLDLDWLR